MRRGFEHGDAMAGLSVFVTGIFIGIVIAAPVGPVNVLCIRRAAEHGFWAGLFAGLGSVAGDGLFAALAAYGVTAVTLVSKGHEAFMHLAGGVLLIGFGYRLLVTPPQPKGNGAVPGIAEHAGTLGATFALTITNPATLFGSLALFGGAGALVPSFQDFGATWVIIAAVMAGSLLWWVFLSALIAVMRHRLGDSAIRAINSVCAVALLVFGFVILGRLAVVQLAAGMAA